MSLARLPESPVSSLNSSEERFPARKSESRGTPEIRACGVIHLSYPQANRRAILSPEAKALRSDTGSFQAWCRSIFRAFPSVSPIDIQSVLFCCGIAGVVVLCSFDIYTRFFEKGRLATQAITKVMTCAIGTASQTPVSFSIGGRIKSIRSVPTGSAYTRR